MEECGMITADDFTKVNELPPPIIDDWKFQLLIIAVAEGIISTAFARKILKKIDKQSLHIFDSVVYAMRTTPLL